MNQSTYVVNSGAGHHEKLRGPIILGPAEGSLGLVPTAWFLTDYELLGSSEFRRRYRPFEFAVPVSPEEARRPRVHELADRSGRYMRLIAWMRLDSPAARDLAYRGHLLAAPWEHAAQGRPRT